MNKLLVLLYFSLIVSFSYSKDCVESECNYEGIEDDDKANYVCISGEDESCILMPLCIHATKTDENKDTFKCSDFPVSDKTKFACETDGTDKECKEVPYICNTVPKSVGTIQCKDYALSTENQYTHYCTDSNEGETLKACQEKKYECSAVPKINVETTIKCSDFDVDSEKTGKYACVEILPQMKSNAWK